MRTLQDVINELRGNDLPYGELIVEVLQLIENQLSTPGPEAAQERETL